MHADRMLNDQEYASSFEAVLDKKTTGSWFNLWYPGLLAVGCISLAAYGYLMALFARDVKGKVLCILFPVTLFVLCGFEHCVANMFLIPFGFLVEGIPLKESL